MAVVKGDTVVIHLPKKLARIYSLFLRRGEIFPRQNIPLYSIGTHCHSVSHPASECSQGGARRRFRGHSPCLSEVPDCVQQSLKADHAAHGLELPLVSFQLAQVYQCMYTAVRVYTSTVYHHGNGQ